MAKGERKMAKGKGQKVKENVGRAQSVVRSKNSERRSVFKT